jgi:hypothetical protein
LFAAIAALIITSGRGDNSEELSVMANATAMAQQFTALVYASYCPFTPISNWTCFWCSKYNAPRLKGVLTAYNGSYDIFAYAGIETSSNTIYVVFRGTSVVSIKNWMKNIQTQKISPWADESAVQVHQGFYNAWVSIRPLVFSLIRKLQATCSACKRVQFVGHSLGGAMASLAAIELKRMGQVSDLHLYTLGSPRVGDVDLYKYFASLKIDSTRLVNDDDIVPHLSLTSLGYHHIAQELWYSRGVFKQCDSSGEDPKCADSISPLKYSVGDHTNYVGISLKAGASAKCDGVVDNKGPPGSL